MSLVVVGINHRTAPVEVRERVVFEPARVPGCAARTAQTLPDVQRVASSSRRATAPSSIASTDVGAAPNSATGSSAITSSARRCTTCLYHHDEHKAVAHAFSVASGPRLDGARRAADPRPAQGRLSRRAGSRHDRPGAEPPVPGRRSRSRSACAPRPRSARTPCRSPRPRCAMARTVFASFDNRTALLVGAGETDRTRRAAPARRRPAPDDRREPQRRPRARTGRRVPGLRDRARRDSRTTCSEADIVVASTARPNAIITRAHGGSTRCARASAARCSWWTSRCRATSSADVAELEDVYLFTIDDLQSVVNENLEGRRQAAREAGELIDAEVERFAHSLRTRDAAPLIRRLREDADRTRQRTLEQAQVHARRTARARTKCSSFLANTLTNRLHPRAQPAAARRRGDAATARSSRRSPTSTDSTAARLMKESIRRRLERTAERFEEVGALLADPGVIARQGQFRDLSMEYSRLEPVAAAVPRISPPRRRTCAPPPKWLAAADAEMRELAGEEMRDARRSASRRKPPS